eukprot:7926255-Alexandrium_andersonii.AAC.1
MGVRCTFAFVKIPSLPSKVGVDGGPKGAKARNRRIQSAILRSAIHTVVCYLSATAQFISTGS